MAKYLALFLVNKPHPTRHIKNDSPINYFPNSISTILLYLFVFFQSSMKLAQLHSSWRTLTHNTKVGSNICTMITPIAIYIFPQKNREVCKKGDLQLFVDKCHFRFLLTIKKEHFIVGYTTGLMQFSKMGCFSRSQMSRPADLIVSVQVPKHHE